MQNARDEHAVLRLAQKKTQNLHRATARTHLLLPPLVLVLGAVLLVLGA